VLVDLGAGVGAVALVMIVRGFVKQALLVDVDEDACALACRNAMHNGVDADVLRGDVVAVARANRGKAGTVVCNPPYFEPGTGRVARGSERARHGELAGFVRASREFLGKKGRACFVYPASELARLVETLRASGLEPKRLRLVHASANVSARVALVEARAAKAGGLVIAPPLVERDRNAYTAEMSAVLGLG
jgi:tRNA1Val (adenine37-N6)-methyltransferase